MEIVIQSGEIRRCRLGAHRDWECIKYHVHSGDKVKSIQCGEEKIVSPELSETNNTSI